jgi:Ca2+-binding RTX toxin-like protein
MYIPGTNYNDVISGSDGDDYFRLYDGHDTAFGNGGHDTMWGDGGNDDLYGMWGNDFLAGGSGNDILAGGAGLDQLYGDAGEDSLYAGDDSDLLMGGTGADALWGGGGADLFRMDNGLNAREASGDWIWDFSQWQGDKIDLHVIDAKQDFWGNDTFSFIGTQDFTGKGQLKFFHSDGNTYVQGNVDSNTGYDFQFVIVGEVNLTASDIYL